MFTKFTISQFLFSNFHIGHLKNLRDKKYNLYLIFTRDGVDIINTLNNLSLVRKVIFVMTNLSYRRKKILFVSENASILSFFATNINPSTTISHPFVSIHWCPGMLSNFKMTARIIRKIKSGKFRARSHYSNFLRVKKIMNYFSGILSLRRLPDFAFFCTAVANPVAISEAKTFRIPTSGIIDTNGSPYSVSYPIFGNDDSFYALTFLLDAIFRTLEHGNNHRVLYFLQRTLVGCNLLFNNKLFLLKFERVLYKYMQLLKIPVFLNRFTAFVVNSKRKKFRRMIKKSLAKNPLDLSRFTKFGRTRVFRRLKSLGLFLQFFKIFFKSSSTIHKSASFKEILRMFRFFVKLQQTRTLLISHLLSRVLMAEKDLFMFFYFILFKIDDKSRNFLA